MTWFRRSAQSNSAPFRVNSLPSNLGRLSSTRDIRTVEDAVADAHQARGERASHFLGLSINTRRFRVTFVLCIVFFTLFAARTAQLQIVSGDAYRLLAEENRFRNTTIPSVRGVVFDIAGRQLIGNVPAFTLTMTVADIPSDAAERERILARVSDLASLQRTDLDLLIQEFAGAPYEPAIVVKDMPYDQAMLARIEEPQLPGFSLDISTKREYASSSQSVSHVLGYIGKISEAEFEREKGGTYRRTDEIGKAGVEFSMERWLRGTPGAKVVEVDAFGNEITVLSRIDPVDGNDVTLSIDMEFQSVMETRIRTSLEQLGLHKASAVALDPRSGEIRALVSLPSYDSNAFAGGIDSKLYQQLIEDPNQPLFPRAIAGEYPSGSSFKPIVAAAALAEGVITEHTTILSVGGISVGPWFFPDWRAGGHGLTDVRKALADSVNTFFYIIGGGYDDMVGLGVDRITQYGRLFGLGEKTGVDLPGEADGFLPSKEWKEETKGERWYVGDTYHLAIGQGDILVTPIQMAEAIAAIANGGTRYRPHVVHEIGNDLVAEESNELPENVTSILSIVREGMRQAVTSGSARSLSVLPVEVAGKTGTAQLGGERNPHAWFVGFAPYEDPEIVLVILIEEGGEGSSVAVPIAYDVFNWWALNR